MSSDDAIEPPQPAPNAELPEDPQDAEEAKHVAMRKRKPLGEPVKPLTKEQIDALLWDPEVKERDHLSDALPKGWDEDYQDEF